MLQCISKSERCDGIANCRDGYDEHLCAPFELKNRPAVKLPIIVEFQQTGNISRKELRPDKGSVLDEACPETHFWCSDKDYCLPVFVRCNGVFDCLGHEDERDCAIYTCPGFYRCRASKVCVHVTHVCDGFPHCPQHDDESLCASPCPISCTCHGLAFFCSQVFAVYQFPDLRYLDVRGSGMKSHQLGYNHMLIHLSLARCSVRDLSNLTFSNLHSLDISDNQLMEVCDHHFAFMPWLAVLFLAGNPLTSVFNVPTNTDTELRKLKVLDLSRIGTLSVDTSIFIKFRNLWILNLSHSGVELSQWNSSLEPASAIREVDLRGCPTRQFSRDSLREFHHLQILHTDSFQLCCPAVLPPGFDLYHCHTTPDEVVSCDNLLGSLSHRTMVGVLATLALLGNVASLTARVCVGATWLLSSGDVVLTNLSVADLGMGLYLVTIALVDRLLAGEYVWRDDSWRKGAVCQWAGVLYLSCRHATTFFISILCFGRLLHHFWGSTPKFNSTKAIMMCVVVWALSLLLSAVPLISRWQFFGQNALCVPFPHTMNGSLESQYARAVLVLVHFLLFIVCSVCEVVSRVGGTVAQLRITQTTSGFSESQFAVMGSLASGFLYTTASLVPTHAHSDKQKAMLTALVYFGSMVSCATNPYLHLYGVRTERAKQIKEKRLLMIANRMGV